MSLLLYWVTKATETIQVTSGQPQATTTSNEQTVCLPTSVVCPRRGWLSKVLPRCSFKCDADLSKRGFWHWESQGELFEVLTMCIFTDNPSVPLSMHSTICDCLSTSVVEHLSAGDNSIFKVNLYLHKLYRSCLSKLIRRLNCWFCHMVFIFL